MPASDVHSRMAAPASVICASRPSDRTRPSLAKTQIADLQKSGATKLIVDVRRTSTGEAEQGLALARLFVAQGDAGDPRAERRRPRNDRRRSRRRRDHAAGRCCSSTPARPAPPSSSRRRCPATSAPISIGEHTIGRAAIQRLIKLPDSSGLWLSTSRYLTPAGTPLHEKGLEPTVAVDEPDVEFGQPPPPGDPILDKAIERLSLKKAA